MRVAAIADTGRTVHDVPRQVAAGGFPPVPEVVGVRPAVQLAVELRVDHRAVEPGVRRRRSRDVVADPAAAEDVAARQRAGRDGISPVAPSVPDGQRGDGEEEKDGARERDGGAALPAPRQQHHGKGEGKTKQRSFFPPMASYARFMYATAQWIE
jgi:hypothetical protein